MFLKRSRVIKVEFDLVLPCDATREQVLEWLSFELRFGGGLDDDNPLCHFEPEAMSEPTLTDTERHLHERVEIDRVEGARTYMRTTRKLSPDPSIEPSADEQIRKLLMPT